MEFGPEFLGEVGGEGLEEDEEIAEDGNRFIFPGHGFVDEDHEGGDGSVEPEGVEVFGDFFDAGVESFELGRGWLGVFDSGMELDFIEEVDAALGFGSEVLLELGFTLFVHKQAPDAAEEAVNALDPFGVPGFDHFEGAEEHFVEAKRIRSEFPHHVVRIDYVSAGFGHFLAVFAEDEALVDEFVERFGGGDKSQVEEDFVPEAGVEKMKDG